MAELSAIAGVDGRELSLFQSRAFSERRITGTDRATAIDGATVDGATAIDGAIVDRVTAIDPASVDRTPISGADSVSDDVVSGVSRFAMDRPAGEWRTRKIREVVEWEENILVLRASALAGCLRKLFYSVSGYDEDSSLMPREAAVRDMGAALEPVILDMLRLDGDMLDDGRRDVGWRIEGEQVEVAHALDGIEIQGHIDFVGSHPRWTRGQAVVVEIKTRSRSQKEYASAVGVERSHRGAALQAGLYAAALAGSPALNAGAAVVERYGQIGDMALPR